MAVGIPNHEAAGPRSAGPGAVFTVVVAAIFMSNLDLFIVNVALPSIGRDFGGASLAGLSWVLNAYAIVFAALLVPAGRLGDRTGQRRVFLAGIAIFTLASAACAAAPDLAVLVAARVVQAAGAAALIPTSLALLLAATPADKRPGRVRSRPPWARWSAACSSRWTGGGCSWSTCPSEWPRCWPGSGCCRTRPPGTTSGSPTSSAWCCSPPGSAG